MSRSSDRLYLAEDRSTGFQETSEEKICRGSGLSAGGPTGQLDRIEFGPRKVLSSGIFVVLFEGLYRHRSLSLLMFLDLDLNLYKTSIDLYRSLILRSSVCNQVKTNIRESKDLDPDWQTGKMFPWTLNTQNKRDVPASIYTTALSFHCGRCHVFFFLLIRVKNPNAYDSGQNHQTSICHIHICSCFSPCRNVLSKARVFSVEENREDLAIQTKKIFKKFKNEAWRIASPPWQVRQTYHERDVFVGQNWQLKTWVLYLHVFIAPN